MINRIFQFIVAGVDSNLLKILKSPLNSTIRVFDLEDGVQDVIRPQNTFVLKNSVRQKLLSVIPEIFPEGIPPDLGIRVNALKSEEFKKDIQFLNRLSKLISWKAIIVPKINSREEIETYRSEFLNNGIQVQELIPIIETVEGVKNLDAILSSNPDSDFNSLFWGHHDYNLDSDQWPFYEHDSIKYWETKSKIISKIERAGYTYNNGVYLNLNNDEMLLRIVSAVSGICKRDFGQVALSYSQVKLLSSQENIAAIHYSSLIREEELVEEEKVDLAKNLIRVFEQSDFSGRSFFVDGKTKRIISPQQYLMARRFIGVKG